MSIAQNKKAFHDYFIEDKYEAGLMLAGWEVKAIRASRVQLKEAYVIIKKWRGVPDRRSRQSACHRLDARPPGCYAQPQAIAARRRNTAS
jgi:SsrA-binding protein